jgi:hypothetical protein
MGTQSSALGNSLCQVNKVDQENIVTDEETTTLSLSISEGYLERIVNKDDLYIYSNT